MKKNAWKWYKLQWPALSDGFFQNSAFTQYLLTFTHSQLLALEVKVFALTLLSGFSAIQGDVYACCKGSDVWTQRNLQIIHNDWMIIMMSTWSDLTYTGLKHFKVSKHIFWQQRLNACTQHTCTHTQWRTHTHSYLRAMGLKKRSFKREDFPRVIWKNWQRTMVDKCMGFQQLQDRGLFCFKNISSGYLWPLRFLGVMLFTQDSHTTSPSSYLHET